MRRYRSWFPVATGANGPSGIGPVAYLERIALVPAADSRRVSKKSTHSDRAVPLIKARCWARVSHASSYEGTRGCAGPTSSWPLSFRSARMSPTPLDGQSNPSNQTLFCTSGRGFPRRVSFCIEGPNMQAGRPLSPNSASFCPRKDRKEAINESP